MAALSDLDVQALYREFLAVPREIQTNFGSPQLVIKEDFYHFERSTPITVIEDWFGQFYGQQSERLAALRRDHEIISRQAEQQTSDTTDDMQL